jgi:Dolichyl-phosphate-mannose-protein mannosyltransferase
MTTRLTRLASLLNRLFASNNRILQPRRALTLLSIIYLAVSIGLLIYTVNTPTRARKFAEKDAQHYIAIGRAMATGDFSMSYVKQRPYRQPLYPVLLSAVIRFAGGNLFLMGMVNVTLGFAIIWLVYFSILNLFANKAIACFIGFLAVINRFLYQRVSLSLGTEPLFVLLLLLIVLWFASYISRGDARHLILASAAAGLAYLSRPNGLFILPAIIGVAAFYDLFRRFRKAPSRSRLGSIGRLAILYISCAALFLIITLPSTLPRWRIFGNPIEHGMLENFMWVDDYNVGKQQSVRYSWRDYVATHDAGDVVVRWLRGFWAVYVRVPLWEEVWAILYVIAVPGAIIAALRAQEPYRYLLLLAFILLLPLVWTNVSNPTGRIPYTVMFPFECIFAGLALDSLRTRLTKRM